MLATANGNFRDDYSTPDLAPDPVADLTAAIAEAAGPLPPIGVDASESETATVRLTAAEKQKLKAAEKRRGLPEWHLIREALHAYGLI